MRIWFDRAVYFTDSRASGNFNLKMCSNDNIKYLHQIVILKKHPFCIFLRKEIKKLKIQNE